MSILDEEREVLRTKTKRRVRAKPSANGIAQVREAADDPHRLARLFLEDHTHDDGLTLRWWREEWQRWDGRCYRPVPDKEIRAEMSGRIKREFDRLNLVAQGLPSGDDDDGEPPTARKVTSRVVTDAHQAMQGMALVRAAMHQPDWLDDAPYRADEALVCANGVIHLPTWADGGSYKLPLTPRLFTANALDYDFTARAPAPRAWLRFLGELWPDQADAVEALQEWFGYCLLPDTRQHKIFLIVGPKRSGKGTIARVLRRMVGIQNTASPSLASLSTQFGLWPLLGKTLAIIADARLSGRADASAVVERLLSISGEDAQTIDRKNMQSITTTLPVRFMLLTNELPKLIDSSGALAGRFIVLRQTHSWYGKEDTSLTERLLAELPGILLWAMDGWKRLMSRGRFEQPSSACQMVQDLEDLTSPIGAFLREQCEISPAFEVPIKELFDAWKSWCEAKGWEKHGTEQGFGRDLHAAVAALDVRQPRIRGVKTRVYAGLRLRPWDLPDDEIQPPFG